MNDSKLARIGYEAYAEALQQERKRIREKVASEGHQSIRFSDDSPDTWQSISSNVTNYWVDLAQHVKSDPAYKARDSRFTQAGIDAMRDALKAPELV